MLIEELTIREFLEQVSSDVPTLPAAGCVSALTGALAAALGMFVAKVCSLHSSDKNSVDMLLQLRERFAEIRETCLRLMEQDKEEYDNIINALRMPKSDDKQILQRKEAIRHAKLDSVNSPMSLAENALGMLNLCHKLDAVIYPPAQADAKTISILSAACLSGSLTIAKANKM